MTRSASFLTDFLFPLLLMGCGCLGLAVINFLGLQQRAVASKRPVRANSQGSSAASAPAGSKGASGPPSGGARPVRRTLPKGPVARPDAPPRVVPIMAAAPRPSFHLVSFVKRRAYADAAQVERLSRFLKGVAFGPRTRVAIHGWATGRRSRRLARRRARWVGVQLGRLGVSPRRIAKPKASGNAMPAPAMPGAGEHTILVVIRER